MVHNEANEANEIILDLEEKEFKSNRNLEDMLPIVCQTHSYALHCLILGSEAKITEEALFSISTNKFRNEVLYN